MQSLFSRGPSVTLRMVIFAAISIALMTADHKNQLEFVRSTLSNLLAPLHYTIDLPIRLYYWTSETLSTHQTLLDENKQLKDDQLQTRVRLQKLATLEKENSRLRELLTATPKIEDTYIIAEIVGVDVDPYRHLIILNKGTDDDVYIGQPIIDAQGVFGQVVHVSAFTSTAMLITDASHALPVQVDRTGLRAVAFGTGKNHTLDLRHIPHNANLQKGDLLITSGLGQRFPANYPVAVITNIELPQGESFAKVSAQPMALLDKSREVLLIQNDNIEQDNVEQEDDED